MHFPSFIAGVIITAGVIAAARSKPRRYQFRAVGEYPDCDVSIVLVGASADDPFLTVIDSQTGSLGFAHSYIDSCELDSRGRPLVIDCEPAKGVVHALLETVHAEKRKEVRIVFKGAVAREVYGCARTKVGLGYDFMAMVMPHGNHSKGVTCSTLVYQCLPRVFRQRIEEMRDGRKLSPNLIAEAFGIDGPDDADVEVTDADVLAGGFPVLPAG